MAGISAKAVGSLANNYKFNSSSELNNDLDIGLYETPLRGYDMQIGRFDQSSDPLASHYNSTSPYAFVGNNPVIASDPTGAKRKFTPNPECSDNYSTVPKNYTGMGDGVAGEDISNMNFGGSGGGSVGGKDYSAFWGEVINEGEDFLSDDDNKDGDTKSINTTDVFMKAFDVSELTPAMLSTFTSYITKIASTNSGSYLLTQLLQGVVSGGNPIEVTDEAGKSGGTAEYDPGTSTMYMNGYLSNSNENSLIPDQITITLAHELFHAFQTLENMPVSTIDDNGVANCSREVDAYLFNYLFGNELGADKKYYSDFINGFDAGGKLDNLISSFLYGDHSCSTYQQIYESFFLGASSTVQKQYGDSFNYPNYSGQLISCFLK